ALVFFGAVAVLGAGVRVVRAAGTPVSNASQPALERQIHASDSARAMQSGRKKSARSTTGRQTNRSAPSAAAPDTGHRRRPVGPLDRRGYVGDRLDMDVATAAQIDSLPGVTPLMARRIVADRMARGPFTTVDALRRVSGVGPGFLRKIDTLITFSGTFVQSSASDTIIPKRRRGRGRG
ncbi:MAG TPA: helix-hairpin-helix domain-containing protein, partial [Gemmatimonadaceae bacterium]